MRKIRIIFACIMLSVCGNAAYATTMCAADDTMAIVLDPTINGLTPTMSDANLFEWGVNFPYGSVWGIATCMDKSGLTNGELKDSNGVLATGGERKGAYCWCKMTHPVSSRRA